MASRSAHSMRRKASVTWDLQVRLHALMPDSKTLTPARRDELLQALLREPSMGWAVRVMSPQDISAGMMRRVPYNLNEQSCDATVQLIQGVLDAGIDVTHIFVDTVGEPTAYAAKLKRHFPRYGHIEWKVARKADATYPIVGAASIAAKVTRDACLENWVYAEQRLSSAALGKRKRSDDDAWETGSGYPGDPKTVRYLKETLDPVFGWTGIVRFSWATAKSMLEEPVKTPIPTTSILGTAYPPSSTRAFKVEWSDEAKAPKPQKSIASYFKAAAPNKQRAGTGVANSQSSDIHQKDRKMLSEHTSSLWRQLALSAATDADLF